MRKNFLQICFIPNIDDGESVEMVNDHYKINVVFNESLHYDRNKAKEADHPIWSQHRKNKRFSVLMFITEK